MSYPCQVCSILCSKSCPYCDAVCYCCDEHLFEDYPSHHPMCTVIRVVYSSLISFKDALMIHVNEADPFETRLRDSASRAYIFTHFQLIALLHVIDSNKSNEMAINHILTGFELDRKLYYSHGSHFLLAFLYLSFEQYKLCYRLIRTDNPIHTQYTDIDDKHNFEMLKQLHRDLQLLPLHFIVALVFMKLRILISLESIQCFDTFLLGTSRSKTSSSSLQRLAGHADVLAIIYTFSGDKKLDAYTPNRAVLRTITVGDLTSDLGTDNNTTHNESLSIPGLISLINNQIDALYCNGVERCSNLWTALTSPENITDSGFNISTVTITDTFDCVVFKYHKLYHRHPVVIAKLRARIADASSPNIDVKVGTQPT